MSAYHCCVPQCTNDSRYDRDRTLSFHKFPTDTQLQKQWVENIRRDVGPNFRITNSTRVCSSHFVVGDIRKTLNGKRMLKVGIVPTLFAWTPTPSKIVRKVRRDNPDKPVKIVNNRTKCAPTTPLAHNKTQTDTVPLVSHDHDYLVTPLTIADQLAEARQEIKNLRQQLETKNTLFSLDRFSNNPDTINFYTGFKDLDTLKGVFLDLEPTAESMVRWNRMQKHLSFNTFSIRMNAFREESLSLIDQFFIFLCRVYRGLPELDLAIKFSVSKESVSRILKTWANYLYVLLGSMKVWPSRQQIHENMPKDFKNNYPKTRVIIDCTELKVQSSAKVLPHVYSHHKNHTHFKGLIGITPSGLISFVSSLYTGPISHTAITSECGLLDLLEPGDEIIADQRFLIKDMLSTKDVKLVVPPFMECREDVELTPDLARLGTHVGKAIMRIKEFHVFNGVIPLDLASSVNQIWTVCAILANFRGPVL